MKMTIIADWQQRASAHKRLVSPIAEAFLNRRSLGLKHPVFDFLFTYYSFSPTKLMQWTPSFEEILSIDPTTDLTYFNDYWYKYDQGLLRLNPDRLQGQALSLVKFIEDLSNSILSKPPRFGCFGLHEWAMVYKLTPDQLRHTGYSLRLSQDDLAHFIESQKLCCTHYDAYRFFTPQAEPLNIFKPTLESRIQNEQAGCLHANMDLYKWATKLWPWIGSDFIAKAFMVAKEGRELDMRASPYDLSKEGYTPICIETEAGRKEYVQLQQQYTEKTFSLRQELSAFCRRLIEWKENSQQALIKEPND